MQQISLLIFDLDGTLVDTLDDIAASVNHTLERLGHDPIHRDTVRHYVGDGIETLMSRCLRGQVARLDEAVAIYKEHHARNLVRHSKLYPGVRETLEHFKPLPMAVVSNKAMAFVGPLLDRLAIGRYFTMVLGADLNVPLKPAPDALLRIMAYSNAAKELTVIVGDGTTDILAGRAAGIITCAATYGFRTEKELRLVRPDHVIHEFPDLKKLFTATTTSATA